MCLGKLVCMWMSLYQLAISRIENGENVELKTLQKIAQALNAKLKIELVPA